MAIKQYVRTVVYLSLRDLRSRYAATTLGPLWTTITVAVTSLALAVVYSRVFGIDPRSYLSYLVTSLVAWTMISNTLAESPGAFTAGRSVLLNTSFPPIVYVAILALRNFFIYLQSLPVVVVVNLWVGVLKLGPTLALIVTIPLALVLLTLASYILAVAGARFPDLVVIMPSALFIIFLTTPVLWTAAALGESQALVRYNPFYWLLEGLRAPFLGYLPSAGTWVTLMGGIILLALLAVALDRRVGGRVKVWI